MTTAFDQFVDGLNVTVGATAFNNTTNPLTVTLTGLGSRFPLPGNGLTVELYDNSGGSALNPIADTNREVVKLTARSGDSTTWARGLDGTSVVAHSTTTIATMGALLARHCNAWSTAINNLETLVGSAVTPGWGTPVASGDVASFSGLNGFRLSAASGEPVPPDTAPLTSATLYLTPYLHAQIAVWGSSGVYSTLNNWVLVESGEVAQTFSSIDGYAGDGNYNVFSVWNVTGVSLFAEPWYTDTAMNDGVSTGSFLITQDGVLVSQTTPSWVFQGTVRSVGGNVQDDVTFRGIWNYYNRRPRALVAAPPGSLPVSSSSTSWSAATAAQFVVGLTEDSVSAEGFAYGSVTAGTGLGEVAVSMGSTPDGYGGQPILTATAHSVQCSTMGQPPNGGLNSLSLLVRATAGSTTVELADPYSGAHANVLKGVVYA